jgi:uncharacterized OsmC-like protein
MSFRYAGDLHCELVHGPSSSKLETDAPLDNAGRGAAFSPTDLLGAALATCAVTTMAIKAPKEGIPFTEASGSVVKTMTAEPPRKVARLEVELVMPAGLPDVHRRRLEEIARNCPVALSLSDSTDIELRFVYGDGRA